MSIQTLKAKQPVGNVITLNTFTIIANNVYCSVHCEGDGGDALFRVGYFFYNYVSKSTIQYFYKLNKGFKNYFSLKFLSVLFPYLKIASFLFLNPKLIVNSCYLAKCCSNSLIILAQIFISPNQAFHSRCLARLIHYFLVLISHVLLLLGSIPILSSIIIIISLNKHFSDFYPPDLLVLKSNY